MALKSETASPPNGVASIIRQESGAPLNEDLEDGEIFDDDDEEVVPASKPNTQPPPAEPPATVASPVPSKKRQLSPTGSDRRRPPRQRRSKRPREDERTFPRKQRRRSEEQEKSREKEIIIDEDELLNVTRIRSPPPGARTNNNDWDRFHNRSDEEEEECGGIGSGGLSGNGSRRNNRGRDGFPSRRRARPRGAGRRGGNRRGDSNICKFFQQGKCQRGSECPFSHANNSHRKYELCKFYMNDCCSKKDKCMFMHNDFPCKFFHLGLKCYAGKRCKFSHSKVSSYVKQQLIKHNQSESDKHFLHNLETLSPRESPSRDHVGGESPSTHHHRGAGQNHRSRHHSGSRRHNNHDFRQHSVSPPHSDLHEDDQNFDHRPPSQNNFDSPYYSDDERNRTPMPSPSQDNLSDRDAKSPEQELICDYNSSNSDTPASDQKDSGLGEEMPQEVPPINLPRKQRELYLRIQQQQQQRHAQEAQNAEGEEFDKDEDVRDEDWYSSDEDGNTAPLATLLKTIKRSNTQLKPVVPEVFPDIDVSAVSKLLTSVRETIQQQQQQHQPQHIKLSGTQLSQDSKPSDVKRRVRDPRLRSLLSPPKDRRSPSELNAAALPLLIPGDVDLRLASSTSALATSSTSLLTLSTDVDLRQLPFKPAPVHQAANEIDASITSHPPIMNYTLIPFLSIGKPDYSHVQPKNGNDPRLRKFVGQPVQPSLQLPGMIGANTNNISPNTQVPATANAPRDPRQRVLANDPRRRPLPPQLSGPPGLHNSNQRDSDLRGHPPYPLGNDVDLRLHPPAPNFSYD